MGRVVAIAVAAVFAALACAPPSAVQSSQVATERPLLTPAPIAASPPESPDASVEDASLDDAGAPDASQPPATFTCPIEMALVVGQSCTAVRQECAEWMEAPNIAKDGRCARFASPSVCVGSRVPMRFCIDLDEFTAGSDPKPVTTVSWIDAKNKCERAGKRLCKESEWNFACEGEEMLPYPTGFERPAGKCNFDQPKLTDSWGKVIDYRRPPSELTACTSPFGVRNMVGNVDEWTERDVMNGPNRSALKGGWWLAGRNRCRPATTAHDERYRDFQTGFRCCADPR